MSSSASQKRKHEAIEKTEKDEWIFKSLNEAPITELQNQLTAQGFNLSSINDKPILSKLLETIIRRTQLELESNPHKKNIWKLVSSSPPNNFFSEVVMFCYDQSIYFCGPYFPSPRDKPVTVLSRVKGDDGLWSAVETKGKSVDPFKAFKRMPLFNVYHGKLIMAYPDFENSKYIVDSLDLETFEWSEMSTIGTPPPPRDYVDGCIYQGKLIVTGHSSNPPPNSSEATDCVVHVLDLEKLTWTNQSFNGPSNPCPNGSSILHKDKLITFSKDGGDVYLLDLKSFVFHKDSISNKLPEFNCRRHSHLIQVYRDQLILIRVHDSFQVNSFDIFEKKWSVIEMLGKRPTKVRTEASFTVSNDTLFVLGGQTGKNHLLSFNLDDRQFMKRHLDTTLPKMYLDDLKDVEVSTSDSRKISAHKAVLAAKSDYFKTLFSGQFKEGKHDSEISLDFKFDSLEKIIKHMYDSLEFQPLEKANLFELFHASCFLQYFPFLEELVDHIIESLSPENALDTFELSNLDSPFKEHIFKHTVAFISKNKTKISEQPGFIEFCTKNPALLKEIFSNLDNPQPPQKKIRTSEGSNSVLTNDLHLSVLDGSIFPVVSKKSDPMQWQ